jgi:hypothetical protein
VSHFCNIITFTYNNLQSIAAIRSNCTSYCCMWPLLLDVIHVEDTIPLLFRLCHQRWTTTPSLLILRFNNGDSLSLNSVKAIRYLQLEAHKPQVHTPERLLEELTTRHQPVWSIMDALEDHNCNKFKLELSLDKRLLFDSNCNLPYLLCKLWSSKLLFCNVHSCSLPLYRALNSIM